MIIDNLILGAGIGGLSFGHLCSLNNKPHLILEKNKELLRNFTNGVHYMHEIPNFDGGVKFKRVPLCEGTFGERERVTKGFTLNDAMQYSLKVLDKIQPTSIFSTGKRIECFVPESNNMNDLIDAYAKNCKINFDEAVESIDVENKIVATAIGMYEYKNLISTIPLNVLLWLSKQTKKIKFDTKPIHSYNFKTLNITPDWLLCVYVAHEKFSSYRMTVLNGLISVECMEEEDKKVIASEIRNILPALKFDPDDCDKGMWETGKIISISDKDRIAIVNQLVDYNIHTFGRYGLWNRRIMIHDTLHQAVNIFDKI